MALLFMDSCDHYVTADILEKWTAGTGTAILAGAGRRSSAALRVTTNGAYVLKGVAASGPTAIIGMAFKTATLGTHRIMGVWNGATTREHVYLTTAVDGSLLALRGGPGGTPNGGSGAALGAASVPGVLAAGVYAYIEMKVLLHDTTGAVTVRVNGVPVLTYTPVDTVNTGTAVWSAGWVGAMSGATDIDDIYVADGTGAAPWNDFLGDCRVDARYPTAEGAAAAWTPLSGTDNALMVDEAAPDDDTTHTTSAIVGQTDTFVVQDAPVAGAVLYGVQSCLNVKKMDAGTCTVAPIIRHSTTDYPGADLAPSTTYAYGLQIAQVNPGTSAAWTETDFNNAEFGYRKTS